MPKSRQYKVESPVQEAVNFVSIGNLGATASNPKERVLSEQVYRVSCLLAYANRCACLLDIEPFFSISVIEDADPAPDEDPQHEVVASVTLPFMQSAYDKGEDGEVLSRRAFKRRLDPDMLPISGIVRKLSADGMTQVLRCTLETLEELPEDPEDFMSSYQEQDLREVARLMGQAIINMHTAGSFTGFYDGEPLFEPADANQAMWCEMALLIPTQQPAICPACGRIVDRRTSGGRPPMTCPKPKDGGKYHSNDFQNEKKRLENANDPSAATNSGLDMKARELHFQEGKTKRPLQFIDDGLVRE